MFTFAPVEGQYGCIKTSVKGGVRNDISGARNRESGGRHEDHGPQGRKNCNAVSTSRTGHRPRSFKHSANDDGSV